LWVKPEAQRREREGLLTKPIGIKNCLIRLPQDRPPIVEFNDEIEWRALFKKPIGIAIDAGAPVYLWQVQGIQTVERPTADGKPVAFLFVYYTGTAWEVIVDFTPNQPDFIAQDDGEEWRLGRAIADALNLQLRERAIHLHDSIKEGIRAIGLWSAPALMTYPLTAIADHCVNGQLTQARQLLVEYCSSSFLESLVELWSSVPAFAARRQLFAEALQAHRERRFILSIHAMVPQIEGVITDWLYTNNEIGNAYREASKAKRLQEALTDGVELPYTEQRLIEDAIAFIVSGPVFDTFKNWVLPVGEFPNRHAVGHGKYEEATYTEENSIKAFLLLDSLRYVMEGHMSD
jgi:hypothetical protein